MSANALSSYSGLDRALHRMAFGSAALQDVLIDMEESLYVKQWRDTVVEKPIFITSLPRAGTTIILQTLYRISNLATHTYRDMPFILTPVMWQKMSRMFRQTSELKERAHGDGLAINEDSPEAFEEVLWKKYFPGHYSARGIKLWDGASQNEEFNSFFKAHMQKIVMLRSRDAKQAPRYISKNNANIARIAYIKTRYPDASIIVPLRHPLEQAVSLHRQYKNFTRQHAEDAFTRRYMADIGHYEFGELHRPILFPGLPGRFENLGPDSLDYWLLYWLAAFEYLSQQQGIGFVSFEALCANAGPGLHTLTETLGLKAGVDAIRDAAKTFRQTSSKSGDGIEVNQEIREQALACYRSLQETCLLGN